MGLFQCEIYSEELQKNTAFYIVRPDAMSFERKAEEDREYKVLYLLHGPGEDYRKWLRSAPLEHLSEAYQVVFVLPDASMSNFKDIEGIGNYNTYIKKELPQIVQCYFGFPASEKVIYISGNAGFPDEITCLTHMLETMRRN